MRKLFYLFLFVALMIAASTNAQNRDWANLKHYSAANAELINAIDRNSPCSVYGQFHH